MSELDDFRTTALARQVEAENALYNGDPALLIEIWSTQDPVTLFGAWGPVKSGWEEVSRVTRRFASRLSLVSDHRFELVAAGVSGTWPTRSATNAIGRPSTAVPSSRPRCASPTSTAARTARGRSLTTTATLPPPIRALPPKQRRHTNR
jgi:hypothetical protein